MLLLCLRTLYKWDRIVGVLALRETVISYDFPEGQPLSLKR